MTQANRSQSVDLSETESPARVLYSMSAPASFQRRTVESARHIRESLSNVIREIEPLVETARTVNAGVSNFLNRPQQLDQQRSNQNPNINQNQNQNQNQPIEVANDSFYINLDLSDNNLSLDDSIDAPVVTGDNNNTDDIERAQNVLEAQQFIKVLLKYVPFLLILLAKSIYDYHEGLFVLIILFITFAHTNSIVKKELIKRQRRSITTLGVNLLYIIACLLFIYYVFSDDLHDFNVVLNLVLIRSFTHPLTVWNLLWIVTITDFTLKLLTVFVKLLITMLPEFIIDFKKRGKIYLFIEAISQMYRSIATIQPWLNYLLESYQGPEKIVAVFLSAFYMISKGSDLMSKVGLLKNASLKLLQNVSIGSSPTKDQIQTAGDHCPICHDQYDSPVLLQCRHIFCESCVTTWLDREQTCPLCRAKIVDDPSWRDGSTSYFLQLF